MGFLEPALTFLQLKNPLGKWLTPYLSFFWPFFIDFLFWKSLFAFQSPFPFQPPFPSISIILSAFHSTSPFPFISRSTYIY